MKKVGYSRKSPRDNCNLTKFVWHTSGWRQLFGCLRTKRKLENVENYLNLKKNWKPLNNLIWILFGCLKWKSWLGLISKLDTNGLTKRNEKNKFMSCVRQPITSVTINGLICTRSRTPLLVAEKRYKKLLDILASGLGEIGKFYIYHSFTI